MSIILASASPRRKELLAQIGVSFKCLSMDINEDVLPNEEPVKYVERLAQQKALAAMGMANGLPILGADTSVIIEGHILGKPQDDEDAKRLLRLLSGKTHQVLSAVAVVKRNGEEVNVMSEVVKTDVTFLPLSEETIEKYVASGESVGKAGAYAIQGFAATFISRIEGSYSNVVGLPLMETAQLLSQFNIAIWQTVQFENSN